MDPEFGTTLIMWLGWILFALGAFKMVIYLIGEVSPSAWGKIKSPTFKKLLTGTGNRLLFGLGGFLTALFGIGAVGIAILLRKLHGLG